MISLGVSQLFPLAFDISTFGIKRFTQKVHEDSTSLMCFPTFPSHESLPKRHNPLPRASSFSSSRFHGIGSSAAYKSLHPSLLRHYQPLDLIKWLCYKVYHSLKYLLHFAFSFVAASRCLVHLTFNFSSQFQRHYKPYRYPNLIKDGYIFTIWVFYLWI